jgi:PAS domain S-box-containing protein
MVVTDGAGVILSVDDGSSHLLGYPASSLVGASIFELVAPAEREVAIAALRRYLADPVPRSLGRRGRPAHLRRHDGSVIDVVVKLLPLAGAEIRVAMIALDLQVFDTDDRNTRREQHLAAAQRLTHCGSWETTLIDPHIVGDNPLWWSDEVFRIFGYEPGAIEVTEERFFAAVHPDDRAAVRAAVRHAVATGTTYAIDHRVIRPDGSIRIVHEQSEIQHDAAGKPLRMIGTVQDITERTLAEAALRRAEDAAVLADRMASVGLVAAGVAHEINNPLAAVMLSLDLLANRIAAGGVLATGALDDARAGLERVREIVRDLRVFSRDDRDDRIAVDVIRVLSSTLRMAGGQIRDRARLVTRFEPVPAVVATEARLGQVFLNLLLNAVQAIDPNADAERNEITVTTGHDRAGRVRITISDTGGGIPAELQPKIFTPFFTTKDVGVGTGLGLSICHRIITGLGGEIEFTSVVGHGTEFRVTLPPAPANTPTRDSGRIPIGPIPRRGRVLIVDDEPAITQHLVEILGDDHDAVAVNAAADALARIEAGERFDVILCDLMMPHMTGMELHAALERVVPEQAARLVAMTAGAFSPQARAFLATGRRSVDKPFDFVQLEAVIAQMIGAKP